MVTCVLFLQKLNLLFYLLSLESLWRKRLYTYCCYETFKTIAIEWDEEKNVSFYIYSEGIMVVFSLHLEHNKLQHFIWAINFPCWSCPFFELSPRKRSVQQHQFKATSKGTWQKMVMAKQLETSFILSFLKLNTFPSNNVSQQRDMLASPNNYNSVHLHPRK